MTDRRLRVLTWNLHGAGRPDLGAVAALVRAVEPDVVGLQEVRRGQAERLAEGLGVTAAWSLKHLRYGPLVPLHAEGMALLTPGRSPVATTVLTPDARRWTSRRRIAQHVDLAAVGVRVVNTHLDAHDARRRAPQADRLARIVASRPPGPCVLLGDLNARVDEPEVFGPLNRAGLRDAWDDEAGGHPSAFTSPAAVPAQRIDHVLVTADVAVDDVRVPRGDWARWSDHLPVVADLTLG